MGSHHPIRKTVTPEPTVIPDKLYFRIGDVARLCQVPAYVLRFWETEFPSLKPNKGGTGQRLYRKRDVEMALRIKSLLYDQGYTIPGARQVFKSEARVQESGEGASLAEIPAVPAAASSAVTTAAATGAAALIDRGEEIRLRAQQQSQLQALRQDLLALLSQLSSPAAQADRPVAQFSSAGIKLNSGITPASPAGFANQPEAGSGLRSVAARSPEAPATGLRLVVEPRPRSARPALPPASPQPPDLKQRDLFASDTAETPE